MRIQKVKEKKEKELFSNSIKPRSFIKRILVTILSAPFMIKIAFAMTEIEEIMNITNEEIMMNGGMPVKRVAFLNDTAQMISNYATCAAGAIFVLNWFSSRKLVNPKDGETQEDLEERKHMRKKISIISLIAMILCGVWAFFCKLIY